MNSAEFQRTMQRVRPGQHIRYHLGNLAEAALKWPEVRKTAKFVRAITEIGIGVAYQKRDPATGLMGYYIVLNQRLKVRKDGQGSLQEAQRLIGIM